MEPPLPPPRPEPNPLAHLNLDILNTRVEVKGLWYHQRKVGLDGYTFEKCRFDDCILTVNGGNFELHGCIIGKTTKIKFGGNTVNVISLFNRETPMPEGSGHIFVPIKEPDGSITIKMPKP